MPVKKKMEEKLRRAATRLNGILSLRSDSLENREEFHDADREQRGIDGAQVYEVRTLTS